MSGLSNLTANEIRDMVVAYEPVWAIGKENVVKPDQAAAAVKYIRSYVHDVYGEKAAEDLRVLYGGGIVPEAIHGFLNIEGVDGFLVGHESINYHDFAEIVQSAYRWQRQKGE
jgi:triosephosphate isomerase